MEPDPDLPPPSWEDIRNWLWLVALLLFVGVVVARVHS